MRHCTCTGSVQLVENAFPLGTCRWCHRWQTDSHYRKSMGGGEIAVAKKKALPKNLECCYRDDNGKSIALATCAEGCGSGKSRLPVRWCFKFGEGCVVAKTTQEGYRCCRDCTWREAPTNEPPALANGNPPESRRAIGPLGHFNGSIGEFGGRILLASRKTKGSYRGESNLHLSELGEDFATLSTVPLVLNHPWASASQEDPRVFTFRDQLHVSFTGTTAGRQRGTMKIRQLYARIGDRADIFAPEYGTSPEKNWMPFDHDGRLFFVYSIRPHRVIEVEGDKVVAVFETPNRFPWSGGHLRGGTPSILHDGRFCSFFHGCTNGRDRYYNVGYYEFEAAPPFRITHQSPNPLLWASSDEKQPDNLGDAFVVFPAGAIRRDGKWLVSAGVGDQRVEVLEWITTEV